MSDSRRRFKTGAATESKQSFNTSAADCVEPARHKTPDWNKISGTSLSPCQLSTGTEKKKNHSSTFLIIPLRELRPDAGTPGFLRPVCQLSFRNECAFSLGAAGSVSSSVEENKLRHFSNIPTTTSCDQHKTPAEVPSACRAAAGGFHLLYAGALCWLNYWTAGSYTLNSMMPSGKPS